MEFLLFFLFHRHRLHNFSILCILVEHSTPNTSDYKAWNLIKDYMIKILEFSILNTDLGLNSLFLPFLCFDKVFAILKPTDYQSDSRLES